jgi:hypothetical protein
MSLKNAGVLPRLIAQELTDLSRAKLVATPRGVGIDYAAMT